MPEIRQSPTTKEWVIIATERAKRPEDFVTTEEALEKNHTQANCPFCPGHEWMSDVEIFAIRDPNTLPSTPGWEVRVVPNKFPALLPEGGVHRYVEADFFRYIKGVGIHEVVVETPQHEQDIPLMTDDHFSKVFLTFYERSVKLAADGRFEYISLFKNHGKMAGTSLRHPHSQIIAMPVVPGQVRMHIDEARRLHDDYGVCVFCDMLEKERKRGVRVILETEDFIALQPFASMAPFETHIFPKRHHSHFINVTREKIVSASRIVKQVLSKLYKGLGNPPFNLIIRSGLIHEYYERYYHWHIQIIPRITGIAGFELGSGVYINTVIPEEAAHFLRHVKDS